MQNQTCFIPPTNRVEAVRLLEPFTNPKTDRRTLRTMETTAFLRAWHSLLWLFPDLHPDNAVEHGNERHDEAGTAPEVTAIGRERYTRSGWPVMLEGFGHEAWRRFENGEFSDEAFYCVDAQRAGLAAH